MAKRCAKCGAFMMDEERFCPKCGENAEYLQNPPPPPQQGYQQDQLPQGYSQTAGYTYGTQQPSGQTTPQYYAPVYNTQPVNEEEMSVGKWVGTILLTTMLGLISLVLLFIWGFGSSGPESRRRYCKAMLIVELIGFVLGIILSIVFTSLIFSNPDFWDGIREITDSGYYYDYYDQFASAAAALLIR